MQFQGGKKILAQLIKDGNIIDEKLLKGKIKKDCYYVRSTFIIVPLIPIYYGYVNDRCRMILCTDESIVLEHTQNYFLQFIAFGAGEKKQSSVEYKKTNNSKVCQ